MAKDKQKNKDSDYAKKLKWRKAHLGTLTTKVPTMAGEKTITIVKPKPLFRIIVEETEVDIEE